MGKSLGTLPLRDELENGNGCGADAIAVGQINILQLLI